MKNPNLTGNLILIVFLALPFVCNGQNTKSVEPFDTTSDYSAKTETSDSERIFSSLIVLNIAIDIFPYSQAKSLKSVESLKGIKTACERYMSKTYKDVKYIDCCNDKKKSRDCQKECHNSAFKQCSWRCRFQYGRYDYHFFTRGEDR